MWNKEKYKQFKSSVESNLKHLRFVSTGACQGCEQCGLEVESPSERQLELASKPHFSWSACESCGSTLGGDRHPAHGQNAGNEIMHFEVCVDCLTYLNYGKLDDVSMMEVEA